MNRGYKVYHKEGKRIAKETLKKKGNIFKYYLRGLISYIGKVVFIVSPITSLADVRAAKYVRENKDIVIMKSFTSGDEPRNVYNTYLTGLYKGIIFIAGILMCTLLAGASFAVGYGISSLFEDGMTFLITGAFLLPSAIVLIIWLIVYPLYMTPTAYVLDSVKTNATDAIGKSYNAMSKGGKRTVFWNNFATSFKVLLRVVFYGAIIGGLDYVTSNVINKPILLLAIIPFVVLLALRGIAKVLLTRSVTQILLFEDLVFDKYHEAKVVKGIDLIKAKAIKKDISNTKDNLVKLFDETKQVKRTDEYDNDMFDDVFKQEAKPVTSVIHKINESENIEVTNVEVFEPKPKVDEDILKLFEEPTEEVEQPKEENIVPSLVELDEDIKPSVVEEVELTTELETPSTIEEPKEEIKPTIELDTNNSEEIVEDVKPTIDLSESSIEASIEEVTPPEEVKTLDVEETPVIEEAPAEEIEQVDQVEEVVEEVQEEPKEEIGQNEETVEEAVTETEEIKEETAAEEAAEKE